STNPNDIDDDNIEPDYDDNDDQNNDDYDDEQEEFSESAESDNSDGDEEINVEDPIRMLFERVFVNDSWTC
ncbi:6393_t:CDS:1, partial [Dentiscutata heterogama]